MEDEGKSPSTIRRFCNATLVKSIFRQNILFWLAEFPHGKMASPDDGFDHQPWGDDEEDEDDLFGSISEYGSDEENEAENDKEKAAFEAVEMDKVEPEAVEGVVT